MAMLTIRNLDDSLKSQLRVRAAEHGCSMEEEVRRILRNVLAANDKKTQSGLGSRIHKRMLEVGGVDLQLPERVLPRPAPDFSEN
uniref:Plasmid stabilization protein n=1 Tax=uncultured Thiotrichaceae bacterium TaxID=298394 RepID=A0A6S6SAG0_9GAMM|nr:MAG: Plasmid stabilization protein [uncultured Thiotrichaceae bacterium]